MGYGIVRQNEWWFFSRLRIKGQDWQALGREEMTRAEDVKEREGMDATGRMDGLRRAEQGGGEGGGGQSS